MKKLFVVLTLVAQTIAMAQVGPQASLKSLMKDMSSTLRTIAAQSSNPAKNSDSEKLALGLVETVKSAKAYMPGSANSQAEKDLYIKMMDDSANSAQLLAEAFHNNDSAKITELLNKLSQDKKDGHAKFK